MDHRLPAPRTQGGACPGCLGTQECWVCLGSGANDTQNGIGLCRSCEGRRECRYCRTGAAAPDGQPVP